MTVKELKQWLERFDDDLVVEVKDIYGEYCEADEVYEDEEESMTARAYRGALQGKEAKRETRRVVKIF